jgi:hypothetical protein
MPALMSAIRHVAENQNIFDADESICGEFREKAAHINVLYSRHHG